MDTAKRGVVSILLLGMIAAAPAHASAEEPSFGRVEVGTVSAAIPVTVSNPAKTALTIASIAITSGPFAQTNNCPGTLPPKADCTISVTFNPTSASDPSGTKETGTLTISDNGANGGQTVKLKGTAF